MLWSLPRLSRGLPRVRGASGVLPLLFPASLNAIDNIPSKGAKLWRVDPVDLSWNHNISEEVNVPVLQNVCKMAFNYRTVERGELFTKEYHMYFADDCGIISPVHDIPLFTGESKDDDRYMHMVVEIPRWSNAKMEMNMGTPMNPIKQDIKKGKMRFVNNIFPHHGYPWNYGALPQTWENPDIIESSTGTKGDNDPLDVCEIGTAIKPRGSVIQVKALGALALIDEGETDWKIIVIDTTDPIADSLNDIAGKPVNQFGFNGEFLNKSTSSKVIQKCYEHWCELIQGVVVKDNISLATTTCEVPSRVGREEAQALVDATNEYSPSSYPPEVDRNYFIYTDQETAGP
ncbi:unnamed protein product [Cyprideis torosa]|uniref:inorganic diphosphatase n=1 Tax=Cyprideis torosa TaxID=163714 RepID=A0A7R8ZII2_9CRUS|nr:unnamed protein product [Cyprideis torosa]CAG0880001.1 unnamed protein product [Cyprideis torosa]